MTSYECTLSSLINFTIQVSVTNLSILKLNAQNQRCHTLNAFLFCVKQQQKVFYTKTLEFGFAVIKKYGINNIEFNINTIVLVKLTLMVELTLEAICGSLQNLLKVSHCELAISKWLLSGMSFLRHVQCTHVTSTICFISLNTICL